MSEKTSHPASSYPSGTSVGLRPDEMPKPGERGILANVYILYRRGVRLSAEERQALKPTLGRLVIDSEFRPHAVGRGYMVHMAELSDPTNKTMYCAKLGAPLFDPVIVKATAAGIYLRGRQIDSSSGERIEFCQMWKVPPRPRPPENST